MYGETEYTEEEKIKQSEMRLSKGIKEGVCEDYIAMSEIIKIKYLVEKEGYKVPFIICKNQ